MKLIVGAGLCVLLGLVALWLPIAPRFQPAWQSPTDAADRAERDLPALGVLWGKVRGWSRVGPGWTILWQPSHGMWLVSAWVPDGGDEIRWRIDAAPWLPGVRLSREAAAALSGSSAGLAQARERLGRRDWQVAGERLLGALPAGGDLPSGLSQRRPFVEAILIGLLLTGAVARHLVPGVPARGWRRTVLWVVLLLLVTLPELSALAPANFQPGVRPWVAELAFGAAAVLFLGALVFAVLRFPTTVGTARAGWLPLALAIGALAGRLQPAIFLVAVAGLPLRLPVLVGVTVIAGWLTGLAGNGLRELLRFSAVARVAGLSLVGAGGVVLGGPWAGAVLAVVAAAAVERGWGTWMSVSVIWGSVFGSVWELARWDAALWDAMVFLLAGCAIAGIAYLARPRLEAAPAAAEVP